MFVDSVLHAQTKHIELDLYFVREKVLQGSMELRYVPSFDQIADIFIKALSNTRFFMVKSKLIHTKSEGGCQEIVKVLCTPTRVCHVY